MLDQTFQIVLDIGLGSDVILGVCDMPRHQEVVFCDCKLLLIEAECNEGLPYLRKSWNRVVCLVVDELSTRQGQLCARDLQSRT
jgi:hypothetical protein